MRLMLLCFFSVSIVAMQKNINRSCPPWNLRNLTLKDQSVLLQFCAYNHNVAQFKHVLSCENADNAKVRREALSICFSDIGDRDNIFDNIALYQQIKTDSFIVRAVQQGNCSACTIALLCGANSKAQVFESKCSLLSLALWNNKEDIVRLLLSQKNMSVNALPDEPNIPLCITYFTHNKTMFYSLFNHPSLDKNAQDKAKKSIVHYMAMSQNNSNEFALLLEDETIKINVQDWRGNTPLHYAIMNECSSNVIALLNHKDINITIKNFLNKTPSDLAHEHDLIVIALLLDRHHIFRNSFEAGPFLS